MNDKVKSPEIETETVYGFTVKLKQGGGMKWETKVKEDFQGYVEQVLNGFSRNARLVLGDPNKPEEGFVMLDMREVCAIEAGSRQVPTAAAIEAAQARLAKNAAAAEALDTPKTTSTTVGKPIAGAAKTAA